MEDCQFYLWWAFLNAMRRLDQAEYNRRAMRQRLVCGLFAVAIGAVVFAFLIDVRVFAQSGATSDWEKAAGVKMSFDVASVKRNVSSIPGLVNWNVPLFGDDYPPNGGLFRAKNFGVSNYIAFAYKLSVAQSGIVESELPKWATSNRFDVEARALAGVSKDQMRLMMQSLLAERFQLKAHFEKRETHIYALMLIKPGVTGPKLQPHSPDPPCADPSSPSISGQSLVTTPAGFPARCGRPVALADSWNGTVGGRDVGMQMITEALAIAPNNPPLDRPVVDQTGLAGRFDFVMKYWPQWNNSGQAPADLAPTLLEALKDQLGLKLQATTAPYDTLIVDHIEEPSAN